MGISDRLSSIRRRLPGATRPADDERLLQLYWSRAELKKELKRLQDERRQLLDSCQMQQSAVARMREHVDRLEAYLGNPEVAPHALIYFQLRSLWRVCAAKVAQFASDLQRQQEDRERHTQLIEFDRIRCQRLSESERQLSDARLNSDMLEAQLKLLEARLQSMLGFWNYFRRRHLAEGIEIERSQWDAAATLVTDLSDDHAVIEASQPPALPGISIDGRRTVNTAVIAYAQQLVVSLSQGGLAMLAKETTVRRAFDVRYGGRDDCVRLMTLLREAMTVVSESNDDLGLKERIAAVREAARYRSDTDTIPLTDSVVTLPTPNLRVAAPDAVNRSAMHVLIDDYWDLSRVLLG